MNSIDVIIAPLISEKSMNDASRGKYTFKVNKQAAKGDIKKAVEARFNVNVLKISTITIKGRKAKSGARRLEVTQTASKKAMVQLKAGQKISIFDAGTETK